jgi:polyisoprenoid-binding protein YceI
MNWRYFIAGLPREHQITNIVMKRNYFLVVLIFVFGYAHSQKFSSEKSSVSFYSHAAIEDITAKNEKSVGIFNTATGEIVFSIPISEFKFAKSLMQEHFNEKYMDTEKFPKANFKGKITGFDPVASGVQQAKAVGKLNIHGVERDVEIPGTIEKSGEKLLLKSKFIVKLEDYKIDRPQLLWQNIAEQVEVTIDFVFKPQ